MKSAQQIQEERFEKALFPSNIKADGKNFQDRLHFLGQFSAFLNFYDTQNKKRGSWQPILMKDPLILLANIAQTDVKGREAIFIQSVNSLKILVAKKQKEASIGPRIQLLFQQLTELFIMLERWAFYMDKFNHDYPLATYLLQEIKNKQAENLQALFAFQNALNKAQLFNGVEAVKSEVTQVFQTELWTENAAKKAFWKVLNIPINEEKESKQKALKSLSLTAMVEVLDAFGTTFFTFLTHVVHEAKLEFKTFEGKPSQFPDTVLLRAFAELLGIQQEQLNQFSSRHLNFYYQQVLKQKLKQAKADRLFATIQISPKKSFFELEKNTLFQAGLDEHKEEILFQTRDKNNLYPVQVNECIALSVKQEQDYQKLLLTKIEKPSGLQKNKQGILQAFPTFGRETAQAVSQQMGIAFASPILFLKEGQRTIRLLFEVEHYPQLIEQFQCAQFFLSTEKAWLSISPQINVLNELQTQQTETIALDISLDEKADPIVPFAKNPDGYTSHWPLFKMVFNQFVNLANPIKIIGLKIEVLVKGMKQLELYNDFGKLNAKKPFQAFGPAPSIGRNFIVGSQELFSKPLHLLNLQFNWAALPSGNDFEAYFKAYNDYLTRQEEEKESANVSSQLAKTPLSGVLGSAAAKSVTPAVTVEENRYFNNLCFKGEFSSLSQGEWISETAFEKSGEELAPFDFENYEPNASCQVYENFAQGNGLQLFSTSGSNCSLTSSSSFTASCDDQHRLFDVLPNLQAKELLYNDESQSGFLKLELTSPEAGFGAEMYPLVVADVALQNAANAAQKNTTAPKLTPPNIPFSPTVKGVQVNYHASYAYDFSENDTYLIDCFTYSPFGNVQLYGEALTSAESKERLLMTLGDSNQNENATIPIHLPFVYQAAQFINLSGLEGNEALQLYFEFASNNKKLNQLNQFTCKALNSNVWQDIKVISDGTNGFRCHGILKLQIPVSVSQESPFMQKNGSWLSIGVQEVAELFADTLYLATNGVELERCGTSFLSSTQVLSLAPNQLKIPQSVSKEVAKVVQAFPSYGGAKAENEEAFYKRVSNRIKTKNRLLSITDCHRIVKQAFPTVFYQSVNYDKSNKQSCIYLLKQIDEKQSDQLFQPFFSQCELLAIQEELQHKAADFCRFVVQNFEVSYVAVQAKIKLQIGTPEGLLDEISNQINRYLAPWIKGTKSPIKLQEALTSLQLIKFIHTFKGVEEVEELSFLQFQKVAHESNGDLLQNKSLQSVSVSQSEVLLPYGHHFLTLAT